MPEGTPAGIDRPALERILQRAAELQAGERDIGHALSPDEVLALGREVGIPDRYLQQALLEERVRVDAGPPGAVGADCGSGHGRRTARGSGYRGADRAIVASAGWSRTSSSAFSDSSPAASSGSRWVDSPPRSGARLPRFGAASVPSCCPAPIRSRRRSFHSVRGDPTSR